MSWAEEQDWFGLEDLILTTLDDPIVFWTTKSGNKIQISDMSDNHIQNCINLILRNDYNGEWLSLFFHELKNRGKQIKIIL